MKSKLIDMSQFSRKWLDVPYAAQSPAQKLDLILPENGEGPFPLVIFVHGGGWVADDKRSESTASIFKLPSQGYALAALNYRLALEARWPAQIYDVKSAVRYLRAHADEYCLNTDKLVVWGNSAGGHLSNMLAATGGRGILEDYSTGNAGKSSRVDALVAWYAPSNLYQLELECNMTPEEFIPELDIENAVDCACPQNILLGVPVMDNPLLSLAASPIAYISPDFPPALYQHGTADAVVVYTQSVCMSKKINHVCGQRRAVLELLDGACHGDQRFKTDGNISRCIDFIDSVVFGHLRPRLPLPDIKLAP
ncbi:MAG: alpha/beta hydrolase [Oscillospiraceae bacterium]|nr:alpha/beta hydrolase [Oscillospiraceae bacterium]